METLREDPAIHTLQKSTTTAVWKLLSEISRTAPTQYIQCMHLGLTFALCCFKVEGFNLQKSHMQLASQRVIQYSDALL